MGWAGGRFGESRGEWDGTGESEAGMEGADVPAGAACEGQGVGQILKRPPDACGGEWRRRGPGRGKGGRQGMWARGGGLSRDGEGNAGCPGGRCCRRVGPRLPETARGVWPGGRDEECGVQGDWGRRGDNGLGR